MNRQKLKACIAAAMTLTVAAGSTGIEALVANAADINNNVTVDFENNYKNEQSNTLGGKLKLKNTTDEAIDLSQVNLDYYFNADGASGNKFWCDYAGVSNGNYQNLTSEVKGTFSKGNSADASKSDLLTIGFNGGTLAPGEEVEIQFRVTKDDWSSYDQTNDFAFTNGVAASGQIQETPQQPAQPETPDEPSVNPGDNNNQGNTDVNPGDNNNQGSTDVNPGDNNNGSDNNQNNTDVTPGNNNDTSNGNETPVSTGAMSVRGTQLLDAQGNNFIMRGVNIAHAWYTDKTDTSIDAVARLGANTVRVVLADGFQWDKTSRSEVEHIINKCREKGLICIVEVHDHTGHDDPSEITNTAVGYWKELVDLLNANKDMTIVNIANEWLGTWGQADVWANTYKTAIQDLRSAGLENVLLVDTAGYGQEVSTAIQKSKEVLAADPTGNTMFGTHMYSCAGADADTVKANIDGMLNQGVCSAITEFGDFQNGADVDEETIINYTQEKGMGNIAWSWKGNGGQDMSLDMSNDWEGKDLTQWGNYAFFAENGIANTSKLAGGINGASGAQTTPAERPSEPVKPAEKPSTPVNPSVPTVVAPDANEGTGIKPGILDEFDWTVTANGDPSATPDGASVEKLPDGGYRTSFDLKQGDYPTLFAKANGAHDFSSAKTVDVVVRNNTASAIQLQPIVRAGGGEEPEWIEYDKYQEVPANSTAMLTFDAAKLASAGEIDDIMFRIQGAGGKPAGSVDILSVDTNLPADAYTKEIAELNRPKSAAAFTWAYPEASFKDHTTSATCSEDGVINIKYDGITGEDAAGIQTETRPGLGKGLDFSAYDTASCTVTNNGSSPVSLSLLLRSTSDWIWQEALGNADGTIAPGESVNLTFDLKGSTWKSKASGWQYTGECQGLDDVRAVAFKVWSADGNPASGDLDISNFKLNFAGGSDVQTPSQPQQPSQPQEPVVDNNNNDNNNDNNQNNNVDQTTPDDNNNQNQGAQNPVSTGAMSVRGTNLLDAQGNNFIMRGVNIAHAWYQDKTDTSIDAVARLGANTVRVVLADGFQWDKTSRSEVEHIINKCREKGLICIVEVHDHTGHDDPSEITNTAVGYWKELVDLLNANKDMTIVNIANEWLGTWGQSDVWANTYKTAIQDLRSAGLENVILVDTAGYGQEVSTAIQKSKEVLAADPTGNTMFGTHMYSCAGADADTVKANIDGMLNQGVCSAITEFGDFQNGADVDEETIINYTQEKGMGNIAWSWKGNGGQDMSLDMSNDWEGNELTTWGNYAFYADNGIANTSKLAGGINGASGAQTTPAERPSEPVKPAEKPSTPVNPSVPTVVAPDANEGTGIKPGILDEFDWTVTANGDPSATPDGASVEKLPDGGYRTSFDLKQGDYPTLFAKANGAHDFSSAKTVDVVVRNNTASAIQLQPIVRAGGGEEPEWIEYDRYQEVPANSTTMLSFDASKLASAGEIDDLMFRIQGAGGKPAGSVDILSVGTDVPADTYTKEIAELNRPKSAAAFTWAYPEASFKDHTVSSTCSGDGVINIKYDGVTDEDAAGIQTETRPGLGKGLDFSAYNTASCTVTNNGSSPVALSLLLRSSSNWTWQEALGNADGVIAPGETVELTFDLANPVWKSKLSNWQYTGKCQDLDDVRSVAFKVWSADGTPASGDIDISNFKFNF